MNSCLLKAAWDARSIASKYNVIGFCFQHYSLQQGIACRELQEHCLVFNDSWKATRILEPIKDETWERPGNALTDLQNTEGTSFPSSSTILAFGYLITQETIQDFVFQLFPLKPVLLLLLWRMEFFILFVPPCGRMLCFISGLLVRDGGSIRGEFITEVLDQESIKKGSWWDCVPVVPRNPHLMLSWWRNLGQCRSKSNSFLAVITY